MLTNLSFIALTAWLSLVAFAPAHAASPNIASFFSVPAGTRLTYPPIDVPGPQPRPIWLEAYKKAKKAGLIPSMPPSKNVDGVAVYPKWYKGQICNPGLNACNSTVDVLSAPPGIAGISFDDGPQPPSMPLLRYLKSQSQIATHFLIGSRMISNPDTFHAIDQAGHHLAAHTYSHTMVTSLTDIQIVGELGWSMQIIHDWSRNHVICAHWRPPYGDTDQRAQAIAKHVFGLKSILWLYDPRDWCLSDFTPGASACGPGNGPQTYSDLLKSLDVFVKLPKKLGLMILQHEHSTRAVNGFKYIFPKIKKAGWITKSVPDALGIPWYQ